MPGSAPLCQCMILRPRTRAGSTMRDLNALLTSLVNINRNSLIAILSSEAQAAERLALAGRQRTPTQRAKRREAI